MEELIERLQEAKMQVARLESELWKRMISGAKSQTAGQPGNQESYAPTGPVPSDYPQHGTWRSKILYILKEANGQGKQRGEIRQMLRERHSGPWQEPAIDAQLAHMEKEGKVRVERQAGRNTYFLA
jgi:hypothetical protein